MEAETLPRAAPTFNSPYLKLKDLVQKRSASLAYIRRLHNGTSFYLSTVLLTSEDLASLYDTKPAQKRSWQWFYLGLSVGGLLPISNPLDFVRAMNVLMLEYENETESKQRIAPMFSRRQKSSGDDLMGQPTFLETGVYTYFETPNLPFDVDFVQSLYAFCDVMIAAYSKFIDDTEDVCNGAFVDAILRVDARIKEEGGGEVLQETEQYDIPDNPACQELNLPIYGVEPHAITEEHVSTLNREVHTDKLHHMRIYVATWNMNGKV
ncbi:hypothetical protein HDU97_007345 [Phlyctochytrium planicorne]|nr:hypothetical protein HDU97_007345 [Phlyctochytrium planicorne]